MRTIFLFCCVMTVSGCSSFGYYMDLMAGHSELLEQRKPVSRLIADEKTRPELRELLKTSQNIRDFASKELYLPENDSYREYADIKRRYAVWNVVAAKEFSVEAKKWCFLFVGCLNYRGYFTKKDALAYAEGLKKDHYDTYVAGAIAYSTLGWFDDPLLNTMMLKSEEYRAGVIFHELAHQLVYIKDDSAFNEAFATTVEQEGIRRWLNKKGNNELFNQYLQNKARDKQFNQLLQETRTELQQLYQVNVSENEKRELKKQVFLAMKQKYKALKKSWKGYAAYDQWMEQKMNNAHLLLVATYHDLVPAFNALLKKEQNNLKHFYAAVEKLGKLSSENRHAQLMQLTLLEQK